MTAADTATNDPAKVEAALAVAERRVEAGDLVAAIDGLSDAAVQNRGDVRILHRLLEYRHEAADSIRAVPREPWPPVYSDPFPDVVGTPPEIDGSELNGEVLGATVAHHGSLLVRNLFDERQVEQAKAAIDQIQRHRSAEELQPGFRRWFRPWKLTKKIDGVLRDRVWEQGGTWLADSPATAEIVLRELRASGALGAITDHFGERPLFSLQKSTLRRSAPEYRYAAWHQDGSFLGDGARAMNVWVALTPCGGDRPTPGLEVVPRRLDDILPRDGGIVPSAISDETVLDAAGSTPPVCPLFEPGDALLFDERMAHRSHLTEGMTEFRYAIECWFFAPANFTENYQSFLS